MVYGLPAAIGAALRRSVKEQLLPLLAMAVSRRMTIQELGTIMQFKPNVKQFSTITF